MASGPTPPPPTHFLKEKVWVPTWPVLLTVRRILMAGCEVWSGKGDSTIALHSSARALTSYVTRGGGGEARTLFKNW